MDYEYFRTYDIGWGIAGSFLNSVKREATQCGGEYLQNPLFMKFSPMNTIMVGIKGGDVERFKKFLLEQEKFYLTFNLS